MIYNLVFDNLGICNFVYILGWSKKTEDSLVYIIVILSVNIGIFMFIINEYIYFISYYLNIKISIIINNIRIPLIKKII
jgi:hypothetical protein